MDASGGMAKKMLFYGMSNGAMMRPTKVGFSEEESQKIWLYKMRFKISSQGSQHSNEEARLIDKI